MKRFCCLFLTIIIFATGCGKAEVESDINLYVDSSLLTVINEIVEKYEEESGVKIEVVSKTTGEIVKSVLKGEKCDISFTLGNEAIANLIKEGHLFKNYSVPIVENELVLITSRNLNTSVSKFENIRNAKNIAMSKEDEPLGQFTREALINLGVFKDVINMKVNEVKDSASVLTSVIEGKSEVGICFESDAMEKIDKVRVIEKAPKSSLNSDIVYFAGLLVREDGLEANENVKNFYKYLDTPEVAKTFSEHNFGIYIE